MKKSPVWHPFTQHALTPQAIEIDHAKDSFLYTKDGKKILDGISSWWVNLHGHCHPKIVEAVKAQASRLDQIIFAGFTHEPAEQLAEKLVSLTGLDHVFYSDSGSTSVEVALKMAAGYWHNKGSPRTKIIALEHGYHGDTFGTMAAGSRGVYNRAYEPFLFDVQHLPFPEITPQLNPPPLKGGRDGRGDCNTLNTFEKILVENQGQIAALIVEPLVLGAGGMKMYEPHILKKLYDLCRKHQVFFIADEVMTGWGRTGTRFACEQAGITPDILCLSKGLTGGYLPLAATLCRAEIFDAFYAPDRAKMFFHSSSYTANPMACAAALASLAIWEEEPVMERIQNLCAAQSLNLARLEHHPAIQNIRQTGTIAAFDIETENQGYLAAIGPELYKFYIENGVLLRPLGNTVYVLPPYCIRAEELERIYDIIIRSLDHIRHAGAQCAA
jgi:adenosylmethionine-8-amino-7-oxononanoate aminotransferase